MQWSPRANVGNARNAVVVSVLALALLVPARSHPFMRRGHPLPATFDPEFVQFAPNPQATFDGGITEVAVSLTGILGVADIDAATLRVQLVEVGDDTQPDTLLDEIDLPVTGDVPRPGGTFKADLVIRLEARDGRLAGRLGVTPQTAQQYQLALRFPDGTLEGVGNIIMPAPGTAQAGGSTGDAHLREVTRFLGGIFWNFWCEARELEDQIRDNTVPIAFKWGTALTIAPRFPFILTVSKTLDSPVLSTISGTTSLLGFASAGGEFRGGRDSCCPDERLNGVHL